MSFFLLIVYTLITVVGLRRREFIMALTYVQ